MLPTAVIPLQHELARNVRWIQIHVGDQCLARVNRQGVSCAKKVMLVIDTGDVGLMSHASRKWRWIRTDPGPTIAA